MDVKLREVEFEEVQDTILKQLKKGVFLTTKSGEISNTMTIAWAISGRMWEENSFAVAVRHSRYTFELMEKSEYFTVSIPKRDTMKEELAFCGTVSGRDQNKFEENGITAKYLTGCPVPVIEACELHVVCKIAYKQSMDPSLIKADYVKDRYKTNDYHTLYYGEVIGVYENSSQAL
ncbi:flavin reductase family protein [Fusibacter ferrireducens]|uniref:Flavin reductase family protein n=1 Tax=Fusibacter ferrireducens TaxID=2785058 RepID=A0ABR9ZUU0_9FIRM|nr:flavin reductase family protein [Fusibacter ferrireducens]MBF4693349.1 flavin reductase family protein [Fusibacter ferrireducens]